MQEIKKVDVLSFALLQMIISAIIGLVMGLIIAFIMGPMAAIGGTPSGFLVGMGFGAIIIAPIFYGVMGFIMGAIGAFLYNLAAKWVGGFKIELV